MADRNKVAYKFQSPRNSNGRAKYRLEFVPTRDLTVADVERLAPEELEAVKAAKMPDGKKLYAGVGGRRKKSDSEPDGEPVDDGEEEAVEEVEEEVAEESAEPVDGGE